MIKTYICPKCNKLKKVNTNIESEPKCECGIIMTPKIGNTKSVSVVDDTIMYSSSGLLWS